jgi:hypothetical protein
MKRKAKDSELNKAFEEKRLLVVRAQVPDGYLECFSSLPVEILLLCR